VWAKARGGSSPLIRTSYQAGRVALNVSIQAKFSDLEIAASAGGSSPHALDCSISLLARTMRERGRPPEFHIRFEHAAYGRQPKASGLSALVDRMAFP
jgi:hypothetical protein